jgi:hypothetical protein
VCHRKKGLDRSITHSHRGTVTGDPWFETRSEIRSPGKQGNLHLFIRTSCDKDAGLCKIYWRAGSSCSASFGVWGLRFFFGIYDSIVAKRGSAYPYLRVVDLFLTPTP